jgi:hypothetical protein
MSGTTIRRGASTSASGFASCRGLAFRTGSAARHSECYGPRLGKGGRAQLISCVAAVLLNQEYPTRRRAPLSALQGEREGEVGGAVNPALSDPLTLPSPPGRRGERVKEASLELHFGGKRFSKTFLQFSPTVPRESGDPGSGEAAAVAPSSSQRLPWRKQGQSLGPAFAGATITRCEDRLHFESGRQFEAG